jgi:hypothetical protein
VAFAVLVAAMTRSASASDAGDIPVTVRVRTSTGSPVENAYVALVPEWRPTSHPLVETIAEKGVAVVEAPAGKYSLIAGARGYSITSAGPIVVSSSTAAFSMELAPLNEAIGAVIDERGYPVVGAHVTGLNGAIPAPLGKVSELAMRHLEADWSATTDATGQWTLQLPEGPVPLLVEAPGRGAEWRIRTDADSAPLDTVLLQGATLTLLPDREDPDLVVTLSRDETEAATSIPPDKQPLIWARRAKGSSIRWTSLPPGNYGIYAKYSDVRFFTQAATKLATVKLSAGDARTERISLPARREAATSIASLFLAGVLRDDLGKTLETYGRDDAGLPRRAETFVETVSGGSVVYIRGDGVRAPFYALTEDRSVFGAPPMAESRHDANLRPVPATIHPRADVYAQFRFADETLQIPRAGLARLQGCDQEAEIAAPIEIRQSGFARFSAAAGCRTIILQLEPFEPVVIERRLQPGDQSLGEFTLRAAASAEVRVVRVPSGAFAAGATVRIAVHDDESHGKRSMIVAEALTDETGWARLSGLPSYRELRVTAETREHDQSDAAMLTVEPGTKGTVDPLAVPEPAELIVDATIDEAFLARFPTARVVALLIQPFDHYREAETRQETPTDEPLRVGPLHPGRWLVNGVVQVDNTFAPVELEDFELKSGETRRVEKRITPNVFEGVVTYNGVGVAAKLKIGSRPEETRDFNTDANGIFRAVLPRTGSYRVAAARMSSQSNLVPVGEVSFSDPSHRVEIVIPKGSTVTTRVRTGDRPVPHVVVWVSRRDDAGVVDDVLKHGRETNSTGEARFDELTAGVWTFSVRLDDRKGAAEKSISIESGEERTIDLDLGEVAGIRGTVRALGGASLPRSRVECLFVGPTGTPDRSSAITDADGKFDIELIAPAPPTAYCSLTGPMGTVDALKLVPGPRSEITVPGATAALYISGWEKAINPEAWWLVAPDGRAVSVRGVAMQLGQIGSPLTIPAMAAGRWRLVRADSLLQWLALARGLGAGLPGVDETTLRAGIPGVIQIDNVPTHAGGSD